MRLVPTHVLAHARAEANAWIAARQGKPRNYWAAAAIVLVWLAVAYWAWTMIRERI